MTLSIYPLIMTLPPCVLWCFYLGVFLPLSASGNELESNTSLDFDKRLGSTNCSMESLEEQVERVDIIFTGTVRDIFPHRKHLTLTKADVEVKRILKGRLGEKVNRRYMLGRLRDIVTIDGLGNPEICDSSAKLSDTRMFLVNENESDLKLNSSLIRLSLGNLERIDAAVRNDVFIPKPEDPEDPCTTEFCSFHAQCTINTSTFRPKCICPKVCHDVFSPVCGSDNITYVSKCHLSMASCQKEKRISVKRPGSCSDPDLCADMQCWFGAICVLSSDGASVRCQCPDSCRSHQRVPMCGSDGKDYGNMCEIERASCMQMQSIIKKYDGKCDPCHGINCTSGVCQVNANREPVCECGDIVCTEEDSSFVCASDGQTYSSECVMRKESCISRKRTTKLFAGKCLRDFDPCHGQEYRPHAECQINNGNREYVCRGNCEPVIRPVCGNDRKTYDNECELERHSCISDMRIAVIHDGFCSAKTPISLPRYSNGKICSLINGQPSCLCPPCTLEFDPVCGSNGISYASECMLKAESCHRNEDIFMQHKGFCSTCEKTCDFYAECQLDSHNVAQCICPTFCVEVENEVCGTDGMTYSNECELRIASCATRKPIFVASEGSCGLCAKNKCRHGARCEKGRCVCPRTLCPSTRDPVCASNGVTYDNDCKMRQAGCELSMDLEMVEDGECDDLSGSGSGLEDGCEEVSCQLGGVCAVDSSGSEECKCNFTCPALRQTVCGSDGRTYGSECLMKEMSCKLQKQIVGQSVENCEDIVEEMCEGTLPLIDPVTQQDYNCNEDLSVCPAGSYCHKTAALSAKCCQEDTPISTCWDTTFGCCADNKTVAPGPRRAGCPGFCRCNALGSLSTICDPISRQCTCKPGVGGLRCDRCPSGHWRLPTAGHRNISCIACDCSPVGSLRDDCDQQTGRCLCHEGFAGHKCDTCEDGQQLGPSGCPSQSNSTLLSCASISCAYGAVCQMRNVVPQCICPYHCPHKNRHDPMLSVCGSDKQTYGSSCQLEAFACRTRQNILVAFQGHCSNKTTTKLLFTRKPKRAAHKTYGLLAAFYKRWPSPSLQIEQSDAISSMTMTSNSKATPTPTIDYLFTTASAETTKLTATSTSPVTIPSEETPAAPTGASFVEKSYLQLHWSISGSLNMSVEVTFIPQSPDGIIFYTGQVEKPTGDFVSLALRDGFVELRFDLGGGPAVLKSEEQVKMNQMNQVLGQRSSKDGSLKLNDFGKVFGTSKGSHTMLNLHKSPIYLGSIRATKDVLQKHTAMETGFIGCITSLEVSESVKVSKLYNLRYPGSSDVDQGSLSERNCSSFLMSDQLLCDSKSCKSRGT